MPQNENNVTLENITIAFRNFAGKEGQFNAEGNRNFAIFLDEQTAEKLAEAGWNVKRLKEREGDEGPAQAYIQVSVSYKNRPPKIAMVTSKGLTYLGESEVEVLDWVDIETADVTLNPYEWAIGGKYGVKAYVKSLFIKIEEDYLQLKWTNFVDENRKQIEITGPDPYIDAEFFVDQKELEAAKA